MAAGDRDACAAMIARHYAGVYSLLASLCRDVHTAEDLAQETFAACWAAISGFRGQASLGTYLRRIAYNKFIDWRRRRKDPAVTAADISVVTEPSGLSGEDPVGRLLEAEATRVLREAVDKLSPTARECIVMHYIQDLSFAEVSGVLDIPVGTVKWRVSQALKELRTHMRRSDLACRGVDIRSTHTRTVT